MLWTMCGFGVNHVDAGGETMFREVSVEDVSRKCGLEFRLLHSAAYGGTWYGRWGYFFGRGSFGTTVSKWCRSVNVLMVSCLVGLGARVRALPMEISLICRTANLPSPRPPCAWWFLIAMDPFF